MINPNFLSAYASDMLTESEDGDLKQRLELYQVFAKLYEHHRGLLNEILELENSSTELKGRLGLFHYIQGVISPAGIYLVTNFLGGQSQVLNQHGLTWTIGRDARRVNIPIRDQRLSRCHAAIQYIDGQGFYLIDLESTNGSFLNGEPVRQRTRLKDGDRIRLGSLAFAFFICDTVQLAAASPTSNDQRQNSAPAADPDEPLLTSIIEDEDELPASYYDETLYFLQRDGLCN
jgi:hypothetical protein